MIPSTFLGLLLLILLGVPGLAYVLRHEKFVPSPELSAFRETLRVIFASVLTLTGTGLIFALIRWLWPQQTLDFRGFLLDPVRFSREHHVQVIWWSLAYLTAATLLAAIAADSRVLRKWEALRQKQWYRALTGGSEGHIRHISGWTLAMDPGSVLRGDANGQTYIGVHLDDGSFVGGYLAFYSTSCKEDDTRDLVLTGPFRLVDAEGCELEHNPNIMVLSAKRIVRLEVDHLMAESESADE